MVRCLFLRGLPDDNQATGTHYRGQLRWVIDGCANVRQALQRIRSTVSTAELLMMGEGPGGALPSPAEVDIIFNEISDADTHGIALERAEKYCDQAGVPVINHPRLVRATTRDYLSARVSHPQLICPKTIRCSPLSPQTVHEQASHHGLQYPLLVRIAGQHGGKTLIQVQKPDEEMALHALPFDGRHFYLSEFIYFRSPDGLYRKFRIAVVDGVPFPRHMIASQSWQIHAGDRDLMDAQPELDQEERQWLESFDTQLRDAIAPAMKALQQANQLEYFGVDCNLTQDGKIILFEVNPNMNILINTRSTSDPTVRYIHEITQAIEELICAKKADTAPA